MALAIHLIAGRIGAEIFGINLGANLSDEAIAQIRQTLVQYKVIFFRQQSIDAVRQLAFVRCLSEAMPVEIIMGITFGGTGSG